MGAPRHGGEGSRFSLQAGRYPVAKQIPEYLKLHVEESSAVQAAKSGLNTVEHLCRAFAKATGWNLTYDPPSPLQMRGPGEAPSSVAGLILSPAERPDDAAFARVPRQQVEQLAAAIASMLGELDQTRAALVAREAELAAGVPVTPRDDEAVHLAQRLEATLAAGAETVGAHAAALYLLDEGTSQLKLRACYGLPKTRLLEAARPLRGALADLEALLGHAVVLEDTELLAHWRCPENYASAVCVPVSTPTTPLGTLWIFSETPRDFSPQQTNMIELAAGRIAADLEREVLLTAGSHTREVERDMHEASRWQEERLPTVAPLIDDWEIAGASEAAGKLSSEFFDWSIVSDGHLALAVADAHARGVSAGLSSAALQAALKAHEVHRHDAGKMLERINETLWTTSPGGQYASLFYGLVTPDTGEIEYAAAGRTSALIVHERGHIILADGAPPLGVDLDANVALQRNVVPAGGLLLVASDGVLAATDATGRHWDELALAEFLQRQLHYSVDELLARLRHALGICVTDRTLLLAKRLR